MNVFRQLLDWLTDAEEARERRDAEAYLARASDVLDLELRMRELERGRPRQALTYSH